MIKIKHLKALKEKWIVRFTETWKTIKGKKYEIQCQSWFNSEKDAIAFVKNLEEEKFIGGLTSEVVEIEHLTKKS